VTAVWVAGGYAIGNTSKNMQLHIELFLVGVIAPALCVAQFTGGAGDGAGLVVLRQSDCFVILPVELLHFNASCGEGGVQISWATATEQNNSHFTVERSLDGYVFAPIAQVPGAGNSMSVTHYVVHDAVLPVGGVFYRLRQTDLDGTDHYHSVVHVLCDVATGPAPVVFPNPTNGPLRISGLHPDQSIGITSSSGELVLEAVVTGTAMDLDLTGQACGTYLLIVRSGGSHGSAQRIIVQR